MVPQPSVLQGKWLPPGEDLSLADPHSALPRSFIHSTSIYLRRCAHGVVQTPGIILTQSKDLCHHKTGMLKGGEHK